MKYALESLPELIGEHQFRDLCVAMGMDTQMQVPTGADFAAVVGSRVLKHHLDFDRDVRRRAVGAKSLFAQSDPNFDQVSK